MKVMLVIDVDFVSLVYIGSPSPRFVVLFGADGMSSPPSGIGVSFRLVVAVILWLLACAFLLSRIPPILRLVLSMKLALLSLLSLAPIVYLRNIRCRALAWSVAGFRIALSASSRDIISVCVRFSRFDIYQFCPVVSSQESDSSYLRRLLLLMIFCLLWSFERLHNLCARCAAPVFLDVRIRGYRVAVPGLLPGA